MNIVRFGDVVKDIKLNVDRSNNPYEHYIAGDHMDTEDLTLRRKGSFATDDVGPAFIRIFKPGQVLYGSRRTYLKKVAVADFEGITANTTFVFETVDDDILSQKLLPFLMLSEEFTKWSIKKSKGSTNPYVLFSDLADYEFELPSISQQRILAEKLWAAYNLKEAYKKMNSAIDEMVKSQFIEMFGNEGNLTDSGIIADFFNLKAGKSMKADNIHDEDLYPCYGGNGIRGYVDSFTHDGEYCLIGRQGALCGNIQLANGKFYATEHAVVVSSRQEVDYYWLYYKLTQMRLNQYARGVAQPGLAVNQLEKLPFNLPPLNLQQRFSAIAQQADKSKFELKQAIDKIEKVMKSLLQ